MSSTTPSAKYSCSGSPLMFWNGSTAIDGLSGRGSATVSLPAGRCAVRPPTPAMLGGGPRIFPPPRLRGPSTPSRDVGEGTRRRKLRGGDGYPIHPYRAGDV